MAPHVHLEMIVAKAENMTLAVLLRDKNGPPWQELEIHPQCISFNEIRPYFLCLNKHKNECLHWLNGGKLERINNGSWSSDLGLDIDEPYKWTKEHPFMMEDAEFRIA